MRSCADAKVTSPYCIFEGERSDPSPNLATCNLAERDQDFVCPHLREVFQKRLAAAVDSKFNSLAIEDQSCSKSEARHLSHSLEQRWAVHENQTKKYPGTRVSGGIFLYPRQVAFLSAMVRMLSETILRNENRPATICETGFGAGHSAAMFLEAAENITLHLFDKFDRPYQLPIAQDLQKAYPNSRIDIYAGDSCKTVPKAPFPNIFPVTTS